jgi:short subunit dehydrogenase-like uncharacterized protein
MPGRIVLFGATGYTGRLVAADLVEIGERPVLAGRHVDRLRELSDQHGGLETVVADVAQPATVYGLVGDGDVLISTVGPFTLYGKAALDAAVNAGAHYLDSTGEPEFIRAVFKDAGPIAERRGTTLLTAFGIDWVPGNVAGAAAARNAGPKGRRVDVGYLMIPPKATADNMKATGAANTGAAVGTPAKPKAKRSPLISTGTRASMLAAGAAPQHSWRDGRLVLEPAAKHLQSFTFDHTTRWGTSVGGSEALSLPKMYPGLDEVNVYMEWPGPPHVVQAVVHGFSLAFGAIARTQPGRKVIDGAVRGAAKRTGGGPSAEARAQSATQVVAVCRDENGRPISGIRLEGPVNGYTLTGRTLAWGAASLRAGRQLVAGAVGPVEAFGLDECLAALAQAGLVASDLNAADLVG